MSKGISGEAFVNNLASKSYLRYWCFPNPYDETGDKKEICDLLILFLNYAIIISVKNYTVNGDYSKFQKKVIDKSSKQLFGAERKLFQSSRNIIIKHPDKGRFEVVNTHYNNFFRITVSVGEKFEKYHFFDTKENKGFVNIFDKDTFFAIVTELDTIKDLVEYLEKREDLLIKNQGVLINCTERDLLGYFLLKKRTFSEGLKSSLLLESEHLKGKWIFYLRNRSVILKKMAEEKSYFIDELVKNNVLKQLDGVTLAEELMSLSRFDRRLIAEELYDVVDKNQQITEAFVRRFMKFNGIGYLFIYYPPNKPNADIDLVFKKALELYSYFHKTKKIILLAATKNLIQWKFGLFIGEDKLSREAEQYLIKLAKYFEWFTNEKKFEKEVKEYPDE